MRGEQYSSSTLLNVHSKLTTGNQFIVRSSSKLQPSHVLSHVYVQDICCMNSYVRPPVKFASGSCSLQLTMWRRAGNQSSWEARKMCSAFRHCMQGGSCNRYIAVKYTCTSITSSDSYSHGAVSCLRRLSYWLPLSVGCLFVVLFLWRWCSKPDWVLLGCQKERSGLLWSWWKGVSIHHHHACQQLCHPSLGHKQDVASSSVPYVVTSMTELI